MNLLSEPRCYLSFRLVSFISEENLICLLKPADQPESPNKPFGSNIKLKPLQFVDYNQMELPPRRTDISNSSKLDISYKPQQPKEQNGV